jgi:hypothetical protein
MFGLWAVATLAGYARMLALGFHIENVSVATLTGLVAGKGNRPCSNLLDGVAAKMSIFAETMGNQQTASNDEQNDANNENRGKP